MYKIIITKTAEQDILASVLYIAHQSQNRKAAEDLYGAILATINSLSTYPSRYPVVNDSVLAKHGFRIVPIKNYLVFYIVREETQTIVVERFLYAKRNWVQLLSRSNAQETFYE
ncbi:MAG: type II toxin-antitoxin system RelE/ParE family toxin [Phascolarctobacterium sp.]|nr:type II toxin-antitoxin system RelE/ParE family toxin [Phascolarctobacterium sp.]